MSMQSFLNKKIIIFGSSIQGRTVFEILQTYNITPYCYIDNDEFKVGTKCNNLDHVPVKELLNMDNYLVIIPTIYYKSMYKQLMDMKIKKKNIIFFDFYYPEYNMYDIPYKFQFYLLMHKYFMKK